MSRFFPRWAGAADSGPTLAELEAEVDRLRAQNQKMKQAMRHCIDCEYRVEVLATRAATGTAAAGGEPAPPTASED